MAHHYYDYSCLVCLMTPGGQSFSKVLLPRFHLHIKNNLSFSFFKRLSSVPFPFLFQTRPDQDSSLCYPIRPCRACGNRNFPHFAFSGTAPSSEGSFVILSRRLSTSSQYCSSIVSTYVPRTPYSYLGT